MATVHSTRPLRTKIDCPADDEIVQTGSADLTCYKGTTLVTIGQVTDIEVDESGAVVGTLNFQDNRIGRTAQELFESNPSEPYLSRSIFGIQLILR